VALSEWQALDPVVVSNSPAHDATNVPTFSPIVLQFSKVMDTNSVQAAFGMSPFVAGTFNWSSSRDALTFMAGGVGVAPSAATTITVRVTNGLDTVSGKAMFAPYEMKFKTGTVSVQNTNPPTLRIQSPTGAGNVQINFESMLGRMYQLQRRDGLDRNSTWAD